ncbi:MAG: hypothetical protein CV088_21170 [Nitrospira sp. LK70]|nr:hypothetical protein [Nitrospira sp. LK70]
MLKKRRRALDLPVEQAHPSDMRASGAGPTTLLAFFLPFSPSADWSLSQLNLSQRVSTDHALSGEELLRIGETHEFQQHFPETLTYYQLALSSFREKKQTRGIAVALVKIAQVYEHQGKFRDADVALREAVPILAHSSDRLAHARALLVAGRVSARLGYLEEARASLSRAVTLFDRAKDQAGRNEAVIQLGLLQVGDGSSEQGLSALQQVRQQAAERRDRRQELAAVLALGTASWLLDQAPEARRYYEEGLQLAEQERARQVGAVLRLRLAYLYAEDVGLTDAVQSAKRALILSQTLRDAAAEAAALSLLCHFYRQTGQLAQADEAEQRALLLYSHRQILVHGGR